MAYGRAAWWAASSRADSVSVLAIWFSDKPYVTTLLLDSLRIGERLDLSKDLWRLNYSMAMAVMNIGYMVDVLGLSGTQICDRSPD